MFDEKDGEMETFKKGTAASKSKPIEKHFKNKGFDRFLVKLKSKTKRDNENSIDEKEKGEKQ